MQTPSASAGNAQPDDRARAVKLAAWQKVIEAGLHPRKNGATTADIARLGKTLDRLEGAAMQAMTHAPPLVAVDDQDASPSPAFAATLEALSRA